MSQAIGNVVGRSTPHGADDKVRKQYTGYERDDESELEFAQARYYNASHGRYTSIDPLTASASIRNPQTFNRYSYVLNSPYKFTDPLGLLAVGACWGGCGGGSSMPGGAWGVAALGLGRDASLDNLKTISELVTGFMNS